MAMSPDRFYAPLPKKQTAKYDSPPPASPKPLPYSTPVFFKPSAYSTVADEIQIAERDEFYMSLAEEIEGEFVGPMPPRQFLDKFLPIAGNPPECPVVEGFCKRSLAETSEVDMYAHFIDTAGSFVPGFTFRDTHNNPDTECDNLAPDVCLYRDGSFAQDDNPTDFSCMEVIVEVNASESQDPFEEDPEDHPSPPLDYCFEKNTGLARLMRGRLASYVSTVFGSQFRLHTFLILRCGGFARLMYWDRCGATVTRRFSYEKTGEEDLLAQFLWRYSHATDRQRGHDPTVRILTQQDKSTWQETLKTEDLGSGFLIKESTRHREFRLMAIPDRENPQEEHDFLISYPPKHTSRSPFGRATRPMVACDRDGTHVFVKDYWRIDAPDMEKEGDIYKILEEHEVRHIAPFGRGNDVRDYETITDKLRDADWVCKETTPMKPLRLYRMSLNLIGRSITDFETSAEFVSAIADAMEGHDDAFEKAKILHRDISAGNILIAKDVEGNSKGILIDWDLSINLAKAENARSDRIGTWQFMSAAMLLDGNHPQTVLDDRESALYVLAWIASCYTTHNQLADMKHVLFPYEECHSSSNGPKGGQGKYYFLTHPGWVKFDGRPHLNALIKLLADHFTVRYDGKPPSAKEIDSICSLLAGSKEEPPPPKNPGAVVAFLRERHPGVDIDDIYAMFSHYPRAWRLNNLNKSGWLVATIRKHVEEPGWPTDDKAEWNDVKTMSPVGKRRIDSEDQPTRAKSRKLHHDGSRRYRESPVGSART